MTNPTMNEVQQRNATMNQHNATMIPGWVSAEVKATWMVMQGVGQIEAYRISEGFRMSDRVLMSQWAVNLRQKAWLIRQGVSGMAESCDDLARIIEEYVERTSNTTGESALPDKENA